MQILNYKRKITLRIHSNVFFFYLRKLSMSSLLGFKKLKFNLTCQFKTEMDILKVNFYLLNQLKQKV